MRIISFCILACLLCLPAESWGGSRLYRDVSFICAAGSTGTAVRTEENIRGQRIAYEIAYFHSEPTLFTVTRARHGRGFKTVLLIDLRTETRPRMLKIARVMALEMAAATAKYCDGHPSDIASARYELDANHKFNRAHPRYRGK